MAEKEHTHESMFISESVVSARVCRECGAYVSVGYLTQHADKHAQEAQAVTAAKDSPEQLALFS